MKVIIIWSFCLLLPLASFAASKRTGASSMDADNFLTCVDQAVNGRGDPECVGKGDSLECIGLKRALEYAAKRTRCMTQESKVDCPLFGHKQNSEQDWMSAAAGHLALFQGCVKDHYREDENSNISAADNALKDPSFLALLKSMDDGASAFELKKSDILERVLKGERLPKIITESPFVKREISVKEQEAYRVGADTPMKFKNEAPDDASGYVYGSNPAMEGLGLSKQAREDFIAAIGSAGSVSLGMAVHAAPNKEENAPITSNHTAANEARKPASNPNVHVKNLKQNPYSLGLDQNIFDRVSITYQKHSQEMQSIDSYINQTPAKSKTLEETIAHGAAIEL